MFPWHSISANNPMNKYLKYGLAALAGAGGLLALLLVAASLLIDPNDYKPRIAQLVKEKTQRTLMFSGDLKLTYFPGLGLDLGRASLSEYRGEREFAAVESVRLYLSWWPLLRRELVVDQVHIEGARASLVRFSDGTTNFDDLLEAQAEDKQISFDIDGVVIDKSGLSFRDEMSGRRVVLSDIRARTGRLVSGKPAEVSADFRLVSDNPRVSAGVRAASGLTFDTGAKRYAVKGLRLEVEGSAAGLSALAVGIGGDAVLDRAAGKLLVENLVAAVAGKKGAGDIDVRLTAPRLQWTAETLETEKIEMVSKMQWPDGEMGLVASMGAISGDTQKFRAGMLKAEVRARTNKSEYAGKLSSPVSGDFKGKRIVLAALKGDLAANGANMARGGLRLEAAGTAQFDFGRLEATLALDARMDESHIKLTAGAGPFPDPRIALDIDIDRLDADRYWLAGSEADRPREGRPLDFSALKTLDASGGIRIGSLTYNQLTASNVRLDFQGGAGGAAGSGRAGPRAEFP